MDYLDDYSACDATYATLRIYPKQMTPDQITQVLGIEPSKVSVVGERKNRKTVNGWFLSTEGKIESRDSRRHIDFLLDQIEPQSAKISELHKEDLEIDVCCFWRSSTGNGGPILSSKQMKRLLALNLDIWWDVWF